MKETDVLTLSALNGMVRDRLKASFPAPYLLVAEISEMSENRTGHCYMELIEKAEEGEAIVARAKAIIWSYTYRMLRPYFETSTGMKLEAGMKVLMKVTVEFHELYGYSLLVKDIDPGYSLGDLALKKQEIVRRLRAEGVMDMNRELELCPVPQRIAIITSPTAAGYGDFTRQLMQNEEGLIFYTRLFPSVMQGAETESSVIAALEQINEYAGAFDAVVIIRGGGAQSELHAFNSYLLALHVAQFPLPVLSGIGHERDETILDLVAWRSFKTPTAVAEFLVGTASDFARLIDDYRDRMVTLAADGLKARSVQLQRLSQSFVPRVLQFLSRNQMLLQQHRSRIGHVSSRMLQHSGQLVERYALKCQLLDPQHTLKRGFSLTLSQGRIITDVAQLHAGDRLTTRMRDGSVDSVVEGVNKIKNT